MTRTERRRDKKKYEKDFVHFCRIMKLYFPDFIHWLSSFKDPRKFWMVIFDATGLFHFKERRCPHCLKKVLNKGTEDEQAVYCHHVLEAKLVLGEGFAVSIGTEFIENENEDVSKNDCETKAFKRLAFSDPLQGRKHPVSCGGIPQHTQIWRFRKPGRDNRRDIPAQRQGEQETAHGMGAGN